MKWAIKRNICATQILVSANHSDEVSDLTFEALEIIYYSEPPFVPETPLFRHFTELSED
jgi:hypothetical protein